MRTLILSTAVAMAMGASALAPAAAQVTIQGPGYDNGRDCRTVEKRVVRNGKTVITREKRCDRDRRHVDRRDDRPGINLNIGR